MSSSPLIAVLGDCCLDLVLYGLPEELPVEREFLAERMSMRLGGSGAITAHNLSCLGNRVRFVFAGGEDSFAAFCRSRLDAAGVDTSHAISYRASSTGVTVLLQHASHRHILTYPGVTSGLGPSDIDLEVICQAQHFHLNSYYLQSGLTKEIPDLLRRIKERGLTISLDPNDDPADSWESGILDALRYVDVFMPNEREACRCAGESSVEKAIAHLSRIVPLLVVKRGALGASAYRAGDEWHLPPRPVSVLDAIGAGDSFNAGFLHGYVRRWPVEECLALGNLTGAWSTTESGGTDAFADAEHLQRMWQEWPARATLDEAAAAARKTAG
jgi:sugar/nucleoside kinase (ribokinase family)